MDWPWFGMTAHLRMTIHPRRLSTSIDTAKKALRLNRGRWPFSDGLTVAGEDGTRVYVNKQGKVVATYEINPDY